MTDRHMFATARTNATIVQNKVGLSACSANLQHTLK
jgi:hypothetical protein